MCLVDNLYIFHQNTQVRNKFKYELFRADVNLTDWKNQLSRLNPTNITKFLDDNYFKLIFFKSERDYF